MSTIDFNENKEIPTFAEMLYYKYHYDGLDFSIDALQQLIKSIPTIYPKVPEQHEKMLQIIKLEILMKFCHYAENLAAFAITFNEKYDSSEEEMLSLFEKIYEYEVPQVIEFYNKIPNCDLQFIAKFLGYPPIKLQNEDGMKKIETSCKIAKRELEIIAKKYLELRLLYNAYKHGYRIFPAKDQNKQDAYGFIYKGKQKIITVNENEFDIIIRASRHIRKLFELILNHAARAEMEKRGERDIPIELKFFVEKKGLPHDPNAKIIFTARGEKRKKNLEDMNRIYEKFKQELETKHMEKFLVVDLDAQKILAICENIEEAVKVLHENTTSGRKSIRKIGSDDKTGIENY